MRQLQLTSGPGNAAAAVRLQVVIDAGGGGDAGSGADLDDAFDGEDGERIIEGKCRGRGRGRGRGRRRRGSWRLDYDGELGSGGGRREETEEKLADGVRLSVGG